jgi:hypothetical protein
MSVQVAPVGPVPGAAAKPAEAGQPAHAAVVVKDWARATTDAVGGGRGHICCGTAATSVARVLSTLPPWLPLEAAQAVPA